MPMAMPDGSAASGLAVIPDLIEPRQEHRSRDCMPRCISRADEGFDAALTVPSDARSCRMICAGGSAAAGLCRCDCFVRRTDAFPHRPVVARPCWTNSNRQSGATALVRVKDWAAACGAAAVEWPATPYDPFFNVNTPEDLAEAQRIAAEFDP